LKLLTLTIMSEEVDPRDPYILAWRDQFGMLVRDKVLLMLEVVKATGWANFAHVFNDPYDDDKFRLVYDSGEFYVGNLSNTNGEVVKLDLERMGIKR
jgi:hypothetical protein